MSEVDARESRFASEPQQVAGTAEIGAGSSTSMLGSLGNRMPPGVLSRKIQRRVLQRKADGASVHEPPAPPGGAGDIHAFSTSSSESATVSNQDGAMAGSIGAVEVPGTIKGGEEGAEDRAESAPSATGGDGGVATESVIRLDFKAEPGAGGGNAKNDTSSSFALTFSQPGGRPVKPFGSEHFEPKFTNPSWKFEGSKPQKCMLAATLEINCPWGTASGGRTDVPSATDAIVTKDSYKEIRDDLKPGASSPFKSRRAKYYSQSLVERHEKFHGTDDWAWAQGAGHELVNAKVKATRIDPRNTAAAVNKLLADCLSLLKSENWKFYAGGGGSHDSYAGEIRAYGDGKPHYQALAEAVEKHGQSLEASAPRDDGKKGNEK